MQLVEITNGSVTVKLDFTDCYAIAEALDNSSGSIAAHSGRMYQVYEAMSVAFLAAAALGHAHGQVVHADPLALNALRAEYERKRGNV